MFDRRTLIAGSAAALTLPALASARPSSTKSTAGPIASLAPHQRIWVDGLNRGDVSVANAVFAPDCIVHVPGRAAPVHGLDAWKGYVSGLLKAFPDLHYNTVDQIRQGDHYAFRWHGTGTQKGPFGKHPPSGKTMAIDGLIIDHLVNGKVVERWEQFDQTLMNQQLGFA